MHPRGNVFSNINYKSDQVKLVSKRVFDASLDELRAIRYTDSMQSSVFFPIVFDLLSWHLLVIS